MGGNMAKRKDARLKRQAWRRDQVQQLYSVGESIGKMAELLNVSKGTIQADLKALREVWAERFDHTEITNISAELVKIDRLELEAWAAWERSKAPIHQATTTERLDALGDVEGSSRTASSQERDGNPSFLAIVERCIERRLKLYERVGMRERRDTVEDWQREIIEGLIAGALSQGEVRGYFGETEGGRLVALASARAALPDPRPPDEIGEISPDTAENVSRETLSSSSVLLDGEYEEAED